MTVTRTGHPTTTTLKIYNVLGQEVATLVNEKREAGKYGVGFDGSSASGKLTSGVYFYQILAGEYTNIKKLIFIK